MNPSITARVLGEPNLIFGGSFPSPDPKLGLTLYGPYSTSTNSIRVGVIGDGTTIQLASQLLHEFSSPVEGPSRYPRWTPSFPGMSRSSPFGCDLVTSPKWYQTIGFDDMAKLEEIDQFERRIAYSVDLFVGYVRNLKDLEDAPHVVVCAPPRHMMDLCIPRETSAPGQRRGRQSEAERRLASIRHRLHPSQRLLGDYFPELQSAEEELLRREASDNFHNFLKAKVMSLGVPTQMIRPYTLDAAFGREPGRLQDRATLAWNLCVALLYKTNARPWRLAQVASGTCYVGISFYREKAVFGGSMGTSLAQVFSPEGEGLVLRGERFEWPTGRSPHLGAEAAKRLLERAIALYVQHTKQKPSRVVLHKSSRFWPEELEGFRSALGGIARHDFVAVASRARRIKFYRQGYHPVLRGTTITLPDASWLLYTKGYSPFLKVYPGPRVPRPLEILQHEGESPPDVISDEILGLTKLNWNSADFSGLLPITLQFSRQVGTILRELPPGVTPQTKYIFYM